MAERRWHGCYKAKYVLSGVERRKRQSCVLTRLCAAIPNQFSRSTLLTYYDIGQHCLPIMTCLPLYGPLYGLAHMNQAKSLLSLD